MRAVSPRMTLRCPQCQVEHEAVRIHNLLVFVDCPATAQNRLLGVYVRVPK